MISLRHHLALLPPAQQAILRACKTASGRWGAYLAGGTALALQLGHRQSEDFDWFTPRTLDPASLLADIQGLGFAVDVDQNAAGTFVGRVGGVSFSVFRYRYPLVGRATRLEGCRIASFRDLAAMKFAAVLGRATRRDYLDIHALLVIKRMRLSEMVDAFRTKFPSADVREALRGLSYFGDVEKQRMPILHVEVRWEDVKADILHAVKSLGGD